MIQDYTWEDNSDDKIRIYTCVLHLLSAMSQETYLYHVDKGSGPFPPNGTALAFREREMFPFSFIYPLCVFPTVSV